MKNILFFCLIFLPALIRAEQSEDLFALGNSYYQKEEYKKAVEAYDKILKQGFESSSLYFNMGNSYYKEGDIPAAILNYERAVKLDPSDEDLLFNLRLANLKIVDKIDPIPHVFYSEWWHNIVYCQSTDHWAFGGVLLLVISSFFGIGFLFIRKIIFKKILFVFSILFFFSSLFFFILAGAQSNYQKEKHAILFSSSTYVKSSPTEKGTDLFILHAGTKVQIIDQVGEWLQIQIANGDRGWVQASGLEVI